MALLFEEDTGKVIGSMMTVHNEVGAGLAESVYQDACERQFTKDGISFRPQARRWVVHRGKEVRELIPDFWVEEKFVLDLKVLVGKFPPGCLAQVFSYCKLFESPLGLLANFGMQSLFWVRLIYRQKQGEMRLETPLAQQGMSPETAKVFQETVRAIRSVWEMHGPGYTDEVYRPLMEAELQYRKMHVDREPVIQPELAGEPLHKTALPVLVIEGVCPIFVQALYEQPTATQLACMRTYLRCLSLPCGYVVNFGRECGQIVGAIAPD